MDVKVGSHLLLSLFALHRILPKDAARGILLILLQQAKPPLLYPISVEFKSKYTLTKSLAITCGSSQNSLAVGKNGSILLTHYKGNAVLVFSREGVFQCHFGSKGKTAGLFLGPTGITIDVNFQIYVCDCSNRRVQIFDATNYRFLTSFPTQSKPRGGIAISKDGRIFLTQGDSVTIFSPSGVLLSSFGSRGDKNGFFDLPQGLAIDNNDNVFVCDAGNNRIQVFDLEGKFLKGLTKEDREMGGFRGPCQIVADRNGGILILDWMVGRVLIFSSDGSSIGSFGDSKVRSSQGMTIDNEGNIFVLAKNEVLVFSGVVK